MRWMWTLGAAVAAGAALTTATAGCGASKPTSAEAAATETADQVCTLLRGWDNELSSSLNATSKSVTDDDDPATANRVLLDGFDELIDIANEHKDEAADLRLPGGPERDRIIEEIQAGTAKGIGELEDQKDDIAALPPITIADQAGALGGAFISLEKTQAAVEPRIELYDDPLLKEAFAANEGCAQVVQH
jgi:hypothetical protein